MSDPSMALREKVEDIYRTDSRRVLATLIRLLGDFDAAEEALHDAFVVAMERWPDDGVPANVPVTIRCVPCAFASPKSATRTLPSVSRMFSGLMSRCWTFFSCK